MPCQLSALAGSWKSLTTSVAQQAELVVIWQHAPVNSVEAVVQRWQILISVRVTVYDLFSPASPTLLSTLEYIGSF